MSDRPTSAFYEEEDGSGIIGYMCLTDFEYEVGGCATGNQIYYCIDTLKRYRKCVDSCGIVEVRIVGHKVIQPASEDFD